MVIYSVPKDEYFNVQPVAGTTKYVVRIDLMKYIKYCLERTHANGKWTEYDYSKIHVTFSNIGWEVPGTIDAQATIYKLGVYGV